MLGVGQRAECSQSEESKGQCLPAAWNEDKAVRERPGEAHAEAGDLNELVVQACDVRRREWSNWEAVSDLGFQNVLNDS